MVERLNENKKAISDVLGEPGAIDLETRDPLAEWFSENKHLVNQLFVLIAVAAVCYYGYYYFQLALRQRVADASDLFLKSRHGFEQYEKDRLNLISLEDSKDADKDKKIEEAKKTLAKSRSALSDILTGLRESQPPYSKFADLYQARIAEGEDNSAGLTVPNWQAEKPATPERFISELQALTVARRQLDSVDASKVNAARSLLAELANAGTVVHANAAIILARIVSSDEERKQAKELLESVRTKHPEQYDLIKPELERL